MNAVASAAYVPIIQYVTDGARQPSKLPCSPETMEHARSWIRDGYRFEVEVHSGERTGQLTFLLIHLMTPRTGGEVAASICKALHAYLSTANAVDTVMRELMTRADRGRLPPTVISAVQELSKEQRATLLARLQYYENPSPNPEYGKA